MTQYFAGYGDYALTLKIVYKDPGGSFAGWFLHTVNDATASYSGYGMPGTQSDAADLVAGLTGAASERRQPFVASVNSRLREMFGHEGKVSWKATLLHGITAAVLDDDFEF